MRILKRLPCSFSGSGTGVSWHFGWVPGQVRMGLAILVAPGFQVVPEVLACFQCVFWVRPLPGLKLDRCSPAVTLTTFGDTWDLALCLSFQWNYFELFHLISDFQMLRVAWSVTSGLTSNLLLRVFESSSRFVRTRRPATPWSRCTWNSRRCDNTTWLSSERSWRRTGWNSRSSGTIGTRSEDTLPRGDPLNSD